MCCECPKEKIDNESSFWKTLIATTSGGILAILGSLLLFYFQTKDNTQKDIINSLLKNYGKQKTCFSEIRPVISGMFEQGRFSAENKNFSVVRDYIGSCKDIGRTFYFQLIQLKVIEDEDRSKIRNCVLGTFENYSSLSINDLRSERLDLIDLDVEYIQPQIECSIEIFKIIDSRIEAILAR